MKKLLGILSLAVAVSTVFVACNKEEESQFKSDLNTGHELVGQLYGKDAVVTDPDEAQGIIFAVSPDGKTAYLCAFTDLMQTKDTMYRDDNGLHREYKIYTKPTAWSTVLFESGAVDPDGEKNTDLIVAADTADKGTAAKECREYFKKSYLARMTQEDYNNDTAWKFTQGKWYLPSMYELNALMQVKDRINEIYLGGKPATDQANDKFFTAIGGDLGFAYWSSTEENSKYAWYDLPNSNQDTYAPKTWSNEGGNGRIYVRPVRKVTL